MSVYILALVVMALLGCGTYLILRQHAVRLILGLGLISHAFNLILFGTTRLTDGMEPILDKSRLNSGGYPNPDDFADPLPHALILTAIVIGFGITAYLIALIQRLHEVRTPTSEEGVSVVYDEVEHFNPDKNGAPDDFMWLEDARPVDASPNPPVTARRKRV